MAPAYGGRQSTIMQLFAMMVLMALATTLATAPVHRAARGQPARTGRTAQRRSLLFLGMRGVDERLGHATRQLLPSGPDGRTHLAYGGRALGQRGLSLVQPLLKARMQPLAYRRPVRPCTYLVS